MKANVAKKEKDFYYNDPRPKFFITLTAVTL